jgi:exopolysaccharide production protein ExoQ
MPKQPSSFLDKLEKIFTIGTLIFCTGTLNGILMGSLEIEVNTVGLNIQEIATGKVQAPIFLVVQLGIFFTTLLLMGLRWPRYLKVMTKPRLVWLYVLLALISCLWAGDPSASFRRGLFLFATTMVGFYIAGRYTLREQVLMLSTAMGISIFSNLAFGLAFPAYAQHAMYFPGAWRGLMAHKNSLATLGVIAAIACQLAIASSRKRQLGLWLGLFAAIVAVLLTTSKTGLLMLLLLSLLLPILRLLRAKTMHAQMAVMTIFLFLATVVMLLLAHYETLILALGRDLTFTGRTDIWAVLLMKIAKRPWVGYGFQSFWAGGADGEAVDLRYQNNYIVSTGHNGFIDIGLDLGCIGLGIFVTSLVINFQRGLHWLKQTNTADGLYPIFVVALMVGYNLSESNVPDAYTIFWLMYVSATTSMLIYRLPHQMAARIPQALVPQPAIAASSAALVPQSSIMRQLPPV